MGIKPAHVCAIGCLVLFSSVSAQAEDLYLTDISSDYSLAMFVDVSTIRKVGGELHAWITTIYNRKKQPFHNAAYSKSLQTFDCENEQSKTISTVYYFEDGSVDDTYDPPVFSSETPVVPGSVGRSNFDMVCASDTTRPTTGRINGALNVRRVQQYLENPSLK